MSALGSIVERALTRTDDTQPARDATTSLNQQDVHDVLRNDRRRFVIREVADRSWTHHDLALSLAADETDKDPRDVTDQERKRAYIALYQVHLPDLDRHDVIDWTPDGGQIHQGREFDGVHAVMQAASVHIADATVEVNR